MEGRLPGENPVKNSFNERKQRERERVMERVMKRKKGEEEASQGREDKPKKRGRKQKGFESLGERQKSKVIKRMREGFVVGSKKVMEDVSTELRGSAWKAVHTLDIYLHSGKGKGKGERGNELDFQE